MPQCHLPSRQEAGAPNRQRWAVLEISPAGSKRWFQKIYRDGKETRLALGSYPAVGLTAARRARDAAKLQKAEGPEPPRDSWRPVGLSQATTMAV